MNTCVGTSSELGIVMLRLEEQLDSFDGGSNGLSDGSSRASEHEVNEELRVGVIASRTRTGWCAVHILNII
mgnify:CR=1 FL=1